MSEQPRTLEKWGNPDAGLTLDECSNFLKDSFDYSRGIAELQNCFFEYALLKRPHWANALLTMDENAVIRASVEMFNRLVGTGNHILTTEEYARTQASLMFDKFQGIAQEIRADRGNSIANVLSSIIARYIAVDADMLHPQKEWGMEKRGRRLHTHGFRNYKRSFLFDHAIRGMPLRAGTHPLFKEMFKELGEQLRRPNLSGIPAESRDGWEEIVRKSGG